MGLPRGVVAVPVWMRAGPIRQPVDSFGICQSRMILSFDSGRLPLSRAMLLEEATLRTRRSTFDEHPTARQG